jgi:hypothetical protein
MSLDKPLENVVIFEKNEKTSQVLAKKNNIE